MRFFFNFYRGKRVLVTGHTGFKGTWLCQLLLSAGADVSGYAFPAENGGMFSQIGLDRHMRSFSGDIRDLDNLRRAFQEVQPEIVFHLAAQPIVRAGYQDPVGTYSTNVMGTVHLLECVRETDSVRSVVNVTTDKVYYNREWVWGYRENERLDGGDPYANSKSCSELVTACYARSFLRERCVAVSEARAGNAIGGGDFAADRIIPDCVRAALSGRPVTLRCPEAVRPYQHVLEMLSAYIMIAAIQMENPPIAGPFNVGPAAGDCVTTRRLVELFCRFWGDGASCQTGGGGPQESQYLRLDSGKIQAALGWRPVWKIEQAVEKTVRWYQEALTGDARAVTERQMKEFFEMARYGDE